MKTADPQGAQEPGEEPIRDQGPVDPKPGPERQKPYHLNSRQIPLQARQGPVQNLRRTPPSVTGPGLDQVSIRTGPTDPVLD